jgi:hypothetical protein
MNGFNSNSQGTKTSSFWLDPIYFQGSKYQSEEERESGDLLKMASVRRSISNFVSIVTGKNIPVKFASSGNSKTNGKEVIISADLNKFDTVCGLALHEGSHIKLSNFSILVKMKDDPESFFTEKFLKEMALKYDMSRHDVARMMIKRLKSFTNYIEDRRIDNYIYTSAPGYQGYYESMYDEYWNSPEITEGLLSAMMRDEVWESYEFRVINLTNPETDLSALKGLTEIWKVIDLKNIARLKSTKAAVEIAKEVLEIVEKNTIANPPKEEDEDGDGEEGEGNGEGDAGDSTSEPSKSKKESEENESGESKSDSNEKDDSKGDKSEEDGDTEGSDKDNEETDSDGDKEGDVDGETDNTTEKTDKNADRGTPKTAPPIMTDEQVAKMVKAIEKQKEFLEGEIEKKDISDEKKEMVEAMEEAGTEQKEVAKGNEGLYDGNSTCPVIVMKNFNERILKSDPFGIFGHTADYISEVDAGFKLGRMLGKKIQIRNEERTLVTTRLRNGKIDDRLIHSLGYGAEQVFERTFVDTFNPLHLHISIDASGSMSGRKWCQTQTAVVAIAVAASMVSNLDVVISYRYTGYASGGGRYGWHSDHKPLVLVAYDSKKDDITKVKKLFPYLKSPSATPEGLCFEGIMDMMVDGNANQDSYFINFSDGQPYFSNSKISYSGASARRHTKKMMDQMRSRGIKVMSYFIGGGYDDMGDFKQMYGKDAVNVNVTSLIPLAKTLNKLFVTK